MTGGNSVEPSFEPSGVSWTGLTPKSGTIPIDLVSALAERFGYGFTSVLCFASDRYVTGSILETSGSPWR